MFAWKGCPLNDEQKISLFKSKSDGLPFHELLQKMALLVTSHLLAYGRSLEKMMNFLKFQRIPFKQAEFEIFYLLFFRGWRNRIIVKNVHFALLP